MLDNTIMLVNNTEEENKNNSVAKNPGGLWPGMHASLQKRSHGGDSDVKTSMAHVAKTLPGSFNVTSCTVGMYYCSIAKGIGLHSPCRHCAEESFCSSCIPNLSTSEDARAEAHDVGFDHLFAHPL